MIGEDQRMTSPTESNAKETTDRTVQNGQSVQIDRRTVQHLCNRAENDEHTIDDVINRLLKETAKEVELGEVIRTAMGQFDHVACVSVAHLATYEEPTGISIQIFTGDVDQFEETVDLYDSRYLISIERDNEKNDLQIPFNVTATCNGPGTYNSLERTTVFMHENVMGAEEIELATGLEYLHDKLADPDDWELTRSFSADEIRNYSQ